VAADTQKPIKRARVVVAASDSGVALSAITNESGRYVIGSVPAGRYTIKASKNSYLDGVFGQKQAGRPGTTVVVADGRKLDRLDLVLARGGVITGTLRDEDGNPCSNTEVRAFGHDFRTGERLFVESASSMSDDRGVYRIYDLPPGDYVISAVPQTTMSDAEAMMTFGAMSVMAGGRGRGDATLAAPAQPVGRGIGAVDRSAIDQLLNPAGSDGSRTTYAPVYFPGTTSTSAAETISLGPSEERAGVDLQLQLVPMARVDGVVNGLNPASPVVTLRLVNPDAPTPGLMSLATSPASDGRFTFPSVVPGRYLLEARSTAGGQAAARDGAVFFDEVPVVVDGRDVHDVAVNVRPGLTISGRIAIDAAATDPAPDFSMLRLSLVPRGRGQGGMAGLVGGARGRNAGPPNINPAGRITVRNLVPGTYTLRVEGPNGWFTKSAVSAGKDTLDFGLQVRADDAPADLVVTLANRPTEVRGTLHDAMGRTSSDGTVIIFPVDSQYWVLQARRIQATRPTSDGGFSIRGLPGGEYVIVAVADARTGEWFDPAFLARVRPAGTVFRLADGEAKTEDVRIGR
jgi:hypothetical protein